MIRLFEYEPVEDGMGLSDIERFGGFLDLMNHCLESSHLLSWKWFYFGDTGVITLDVKHMSIIKL